MKTRIFALITLVLVGIHNGASIFGWYESMPWFDYIPHFFAGFWLIFAIILLSERYRLLDISMFKPITAIIILVSIVMFFGVLWEFFEYGLDAVSFSQKGEIFEIQPTREDILTDLFFDLLGASSAVLLLVLVRRKNQRSAANENNTPNF